MTTKEFLTYFASYINFVYPETFSGRPLYRFSFQTLGEKVLNKLFAITHERADKKINIKVNYAERITMAYIFEIYPIPPELAPIELQILDRLQLN